jgi:hypothetical protein
MKTRVKASDRIELSTNCRQLKLNRLMERNMLRIAQILKEYSELFSPFHHQKQTYEKMTYE